MKPAEFARLVERDGGRCLHCGEVEAIAPNHRANRGMGGSKARHRASNLVLICSRLNGLIESSHSAATIAHRYGWKLRSWEDPEVVPVFDRMNGNWYLLDDEYRRVAIPVPESLLSSNAKEQNGIASEH